MIKRNHPLTVGEKVFDVNMMYIYHITAIDTDRNIVYLSMTDDDIAENLKMFDCELEEKDYETDSPEQDVYQFAEGIVDSRLGMPVCYEHNTEIGWPGDEEDEHEDGDSYYPYYSPYLDENLFGIEVEGDTVGDMDFDLPSNELHDVVVALNEFAVKGLDKKTPVVVEDENGRIEHIEHLWYDRERDMIRISVKDVEFVDAEN